MPSAGVPLILRVAGLPAEAMAPFSSDLGRHVERGLRLEAELDAVRDRMVERLHDAIPRASRTERRLLITAKRACFNRRRLGAAAREAGLTGLVGPLAAELAEREEGLDRWQDEFEAAYRRQRDHERRALAELLDDAAFLRGLALASPVLAASLPRLRGLPPATRDRRDRRSARLETSLLRYASRAAFKLSPLSTLTRAALGLVSGSASGIELRSAGAWRERSRVRLDRRLVDQVSFLLCRHPAVRLDLPVVLNETLERTDAARYRFLRPGGWKLDREGCRPERRLGPALLGVRAEGPLIPALIGELARGPATCRELLLRLQRAFPEESPDALRSRVDDLLDAGILRLAPPWRSEDLDFEARLLAHLAALRQDELEPLVDLLGQSLRLLPGYPEAPSPARLLGEAGRLAGELLRQAVRLGGPPDLLIEPGEHPVKEDVFLRAGAGDPDSPEVARIARPAVEAVLADLEPLVRLSNLDSRRHDLLHTLAAFGHRQWPGRGEVGLLDFLHAALPLCRAYLDFDRKTPGAGGMLAAPAFNPLDVPAIERLGHWRQLVREGIGDCLEPCGVEQRLCRASAARLLDQVPSLYAGPHGFCAIVQPLDGSGASWVLNRLLDGSGRLSSRYTAVMDEDLRDRWTAYYTARSVCEQDGERGELVDLDCTLGHSLNVHALQTRRVLEVPGESSPAPPGRSIRLRDLRVQLSGPDRYPRLVDAAGRRLLPVHLGGRGWRFLPELLKLLVLLGPGELRPCLPMKGARREGDVLIGDRHRTGSVVYARRTWTFDASVLRSRLERAADAQAFLAVHAWRLERGFPDRVFLAEPVGGGAGSRHKPQYVDFTSPLFVEIFRSAVQAGAGELEIAEALPDPEALLRGEDGRRWAVEVQLDNLGF